MVKVFAVSSKGPAPVFIGNQSLWDNTEINDLTVLNGGKFLTGRKLPLYQYSYPIELFIIHPV